MITLTIKTITVIHPATKIAIIIIDMTTIITSKTITIIAIQPLVYMIIITSRDILLTYTI